MPVSVCQRSDSQPEASTPTSWSTRTTSAIPASQASTLSSQLLRDGSPRGCQKRFLGGATGGSVTTTMRVASRGARAAVNLSRARSSQPSLAAGSVPPLEDGHAVLVEQVGQGLSRRQLAGLAVGA